MKMLLALALVPVAAFAGLGMSEGNSCHAEGGATERATLALPPSSQGDAQVYVYQSPSPADGRSGIYTESNSLRGLQTTPWEKVCGSNREVLSEADASILDAPTTLPTEGLE